MISYQKIYAKPQRYKINKRENQRFLKLILLLKQIETLTNLVKSHKVLYY